MSNDTGGFERSLEGVSKVSVWRRIINLIMMFESSPYFEGSLDYFEKRIASLEREVAKLQSRAGPSDGDDQPSITEANRGAEAVGVSCVTPGT